jgi:hypothetical protein
MKNKKKFLCAGSNSPHFKGAGVKARRLPCPITSDSSHHNAPAKLHISTNAAPPIMSVDSLKAKSLWSARQRTAEDITISLLCFHKLFTHYFRVLQPDLHLKSRSHHPSTAHPAWRSTKISFSRLWQPLPWLLGHSSTSALPRTVSCCWMGRYYLPRSALCGLPVFALRPR